MFQSSDCAVDARGVEVRSMVIVFSENTLVAFVVSLGVFISSFRYGMWPKVSKGTTHVHNAHTLQCVALSRLDWGDSIFQDYIFPSKSLPNLGSSTDALIKSSAGAAECWRCAVPSTPHESVYSAADASGGPWKMHTDTKGPFLDTRGILEAWPQTCEATAAAFSPRPCCRGCRCHCRHRCRRHCLFSNIRAGSERQALLQACLSR